MGLASLVKPANGFFRPDYVLQRQFRDLGVMPALATLRLAWERAPVCVSSSHRSNWLARTVPGAAFPAPPGSLRPRDPGHLFPPKPVAGSAKSSAQQAQGFVVMPASPGAGLVLVQAYVLLFPSQTPFLYANGASHVCQGLQRGILRRSGQVVAGFAAVPVPAVDGPVFAGLAPAGRSHPWALTR